MKERERRPYGPAFSTSRRTKPVGKKWCEKCRHWVRHDNRDHPALCNPATRKRAS